MIAFISGKIIDKSERSITVLTAGLGYRIFATSDLLAESSAQQSIELFIHTAVKEDDISLFGFKKKAELDFFEQLLTVSGIGPRMALEILTCPLSITQNAILSEDIATLTKIKGLGKKTAERLCLELKNKMQLPLDLQVARGEHSVQEEAVLALESLGYERVHILKSITTLPVEIKDTEAMVRHFLKSS